MADRHPPCVLDAGPPPDAVSDSVTSYLRRNPGSAGIAEKQIFGPDNLPPTEAFHGRQVVIKKGKHPLPEPRRLCSFPRYCAQVRLESAFARGIRSWQSLDGLPAAGSFPPPVVRIVGTIETPLGPPFAKAELTVFTISSFVGCANCRNWKGLVIDQDPTLKLSFRVR